MRLSTEELTNEIAVTDDMQNWQEDKKDSIDELTLEQYLERMLIQHGVAKKDVIKKAQLDTTYGYQIFQGKKNPSRDILLKLAFGFHLTVDETKRLLYYGNAGTLYPRVKRDAYIMYALHRQFTVTQLNQYLYDKNEKTFNE